MKMQADKVEVSWDDTKKKWLVRIVIGEEVIRRYYGGPKGTDQETLRSSAQKTATEEGYTVDPEHILIQ